MKTILRLWKSISNFGIHKVPEQDKRSVIILNRTSFIIVLISLSGLAATLSEYWFANIGKPGVGSLRLALMALSGLVSFFFVSRRWYFAAKIIISVFPAFFLIIFNTILGDVKIEYYFYFPPAGIGLAIIPVLLFPLKKDRILLICLVFFCFLLTVTSDNLLSVYSSNLKSQDIFGERYFFYKISAILLFLFIILTVFALKDINTKYEEILAAQNQRLKQQKEELTTQSDELKSKNEELFELNHHLGQTNQELERFKNSLEDIVKSRTAELSESELRFRSIFENANDAIFIMKGNIFMDCNVQATEMFGYLKEEIIGESPQFFSPAYQSNGSKSAEIALEKTGSALEGLPQRFEWIHIRKDGRLFDAEISLNRLNITNDNLLLAVVRDITERKNSERALIDSERKFRSIFDKTKHGILILGPDLSVLAANKAVYDITGHLEEKNAPHNVLDILPPEYQKLAMERADLVARGKNLGPFEYKVKFNDGRIHIVEVESSAMDYYGYHAILVILRDVSHIREAEQRVLEAIIQTEESERSRIAQDLHDGLGPVLSTIKIYFQVYLDTMDLIKKEEIVTKLRTTIEEAIESISEISHNISPHVLKNYGFYAALKQFIHRITLTSIIKIHFHCAEEPALCPNTEISLYRAITELINNSIKHSGCSNIFIDILHDNENIKVDYADDGRGFNIKEVTTKSIHGSGVNNIMNRINALQGKVRFSSKQGNGMKAYIEIPMIN